MFELWVWCSLKGWYNIDILLILGFGFGLVSVCGIAGDLACVGVFSWGVLGTVSWVVLGLFALFDLRYLSCVMCCRD